MTTLRDLHKKWMKDPEYGREYDALEEEFALILEAAKARNPATRPPAASSISCPMAMWPRRGRSA